MPQLLLPSHYFRCPYNVQIIIPYGHRRETQSSSYEFTGVVASTILLTPHSDKFWKNRKPVSRRYIAGWSHDPRTGTACWSWGHHTNLDNNMIVGSWDKRREPALTSQGHRAIFELISLDCSITVQFSYNLCKVSVRTAPFCRRKKSWVIVKNVNTYVVAKSPGKSYQKS